MLVQQGAFARAAGACGWWCDLGFDKARPLYNRPDALERYKPGPLGEKRGRFRWKRTLVKSTAIDIPRSLENICFKQPTSVPFSLIISFMGSDSYQPQSTRKFANSQGAVTLNVKVVHVVVVDVVVVPCICILNSWGWVQSLVPRLYDALWVKLAVTIVFSSCFGILGAGRSTVEESDPQKNNKKSMPESSGDTSDILSQMVRRNRQGIVVGSTPRQYKHWNIKSPGNMSQSHFNHFGRHGHGLSQRKQRWLICNN